ncbi:MAG: hypothetical protein OSB66_00295 [SAR202 cluster bacterium]|nr:hypothetical protein [SAR202 cluster bacterium]
MVCHSLADHGHEPIIIDSMITGSCQQVINSRHSMVISPMMI